MRSQSSTKSNNFYKYLRGSFAGKDYQQTYQEHLEIANYTKSDKKTNPYLSTNLKHIKNFQSQQDLMSREKQKRKVKAQAIKEKSGEVQQSQAIQSKEDDNMLEKIQSLSDQEGYEKQDINNQQQEAGKTDSQKLQEYKQKIAVELKLQAEENLKKMKNRYQKLDKLPLNLSSNNKNSLQNIQKKNPNLAEALEVYSQSCGIYEIMQKSLSNAPSFGRLRSSISQSADKKHYLPQINQVDTSDEPLLIKLIKHQQLLEKEKSSRKADSQNGKNQHAQNLKAKEKESNKIQDELRKKIDIYKKELEKERQTKQTIHQLTEQLKILMKDQNLMNKSLLNYISVKDTLAFFSQNKIFSFFYIGKGNNSEIVRRILETRVLMQEIDEIHPEVNFEWHPFSRPIQFSKLGQKNDILFHKKVVNHFEFHHEITTKSNLVKNMKNYCAENKLDIFEYTPITFEINVDGNNFSNEMRIFLQYYMKNLPTHLKTAKDSIEIKKKNGRLTFQLRPNENPQGGFDRKETLPNAPNFVMKESYIAPGPGKSPYVWLLKPINLNRGRGIEVFSTLEDLEKLVNEYYMGFPEKNFKEEQQKIIEEKKENPQSQTDRIINKLESLNSERTSNSSTGTESSKFVKSQEVTNNIRFMNKIGVTNNVESPNNNTLNENTNNLQSGNNLSNNKEENQIQENEENEENAKSAEEIDKQQQNSQSQTQIPSNEITSSAQNKQVKKSPEIAVVSIQSQIKQAQLEPLTSSSQINIAKGISLLPRKPQTASVSSSSVTITTTPFQRKGIFESLRQSVQIKEKPKHIIQENQFVIQKYIERPLLINKRKFDIRVWVLVTQNMDAFVFKQGYLRMSSEEYDITDLQNPFIHLTNNAVQQHSKDYGKFENGNQMSFPDFQAFLELKYPTQNSPLRDKILPKMEEQIKISLMGVKNKLNMNQRPNNFELFGYDFIIDELFNVWIIEVNTNPCIEESSPILKVLLPRMLDDAFKLTIDQILKIDLSQRKIKFPVPGYLDDDNMWKFVCALQPSCSQYRN